LLGPEFALKKNQKNIPDIDAKRIEVVLFDSRRRTGNDILVLMLSRK